MEVALDQAGVILENTPLTLKLYLYLFAEIWEVSGTVLLALPQRFRNPYPTYFHVV
jgi:hypothetical protein